MRRNQLLIALSVAVMALVVGGGLFATDRDANASLAMSEMTVKKLTCGSCVANITSALAGVAGVESVEVSVTTGRSQVRFNPALVDAEKIAQVVTDAGYPATVTQQLSAEQFQALQNEEAMLAEIYVAKIGERLLARDEFEQRVKQNLVAGGLEDRPELKAKTVNQTWQTLKQRILLLAAAEKNQIVVQDGEVELKIKQLQQQLPNFDSYVTKNFGSTENLFQQTKEDLIINKNIQENVLAGLTNSYQRQTKFNQWFKELVGNASVTIYDAQLKQAGSSSGGCGSGSGGGCCG